MNAVDVKPKRWRIPAQGRAREIYFDFPGVDKCSVEEWEDMLYLTKLEIAPLFRGQRIGSHVLQELKKLGKPIRLIPYPDDVDRFDDLLRFYVRNGFRSVTGDDTMLWTP